MSMTSEELETIWRMLPAPKPGTLSGRRIPALPHERALWLAVDDRNRHHLLLKVEPHTEPVAHHTRGLEVRTDELTIGDEPPATYIDLECVEPTLYGTFLAVVRDIAATVVLRDSDPREVLLTCLDRWKWFWSVDPSGLGPQEILGLFGELWFLVRWLGPTRESLEHWQGPSGFRHDFQWPSASFEVKATTVRSDGSATHRIRSIDQLENPETGTLYLFSLQLTHDDLSVNTLAGLVEHVADRLRADDPDGVRIFFERLGQCNYSPAHADKYRTPLRVVAEELYRVEEDFPRVTRGSFPGGLPQGIMDIAYSLSLDACRPWRVAVSPDEFQRPQDAGGASPRGRAPDPSGRS